MHAGLLSHADRRAAGRRAGSPQSQKARAAAGARGREDQRRSRSPSRAAARTWRAAHARADATATDYVVNGEKTFITSGMRADFYTVAVRTGEPGRVRRLAAADGARHAGFTARAAQEDGLVVLRHGAPALRRCARADRQPASGAEDAGFRVIMHNFNAERFSHGGVRRRLRVGLLRRGARVGARAQDLRPAAGRPPGRAPPVRRHADARQPRARCSTTSPGGSIRRRDDPAWSRSCCMAKNIATRTMQFCADAAVQTLGGMGFMRGTQVRAHLPRGQGEHDRRRRRGDHEGPGRAAVGAMSLRGRAHAAPKRSAGRRATGSRRTQP